MLTVMMRPNLRLSAYAVVKHPNLHHRAQSQPAQVIKYNMPNLDGWGFHLVEWMYSLPEPPKRQRTKPMEVICIGMPRSGTESLQHALIRLGYDHTYHGWDINFESPNYAQQWVRLCRKKQVPRAVNCVFCW